MPDPAVRPGAEVAADNGFEALAGRRVGVVLNRASQVAGRPLLDVLAEAPEVDLVAVFAPEHGVRAEAPAGESIDDGVDDRTGLPVHSLYGETREPTPAMLEGIELLVVDLQDVGSRAYTYVSTMGGVMQAAARAGIPVVVLDRPNPLGGEYLDGPVLDPAFASFVGRYPVPAAHGMTAGELAQAILGEGWLPDLAGLDLTVVRVEGWARSERWDDTGLPWPAPSPSLPTTTAVAVYPGTVLFEATNLSVGRGTGEPFTTIGAPWLDATTVAAELNGLSLPGVGFEPVTFEPVGSDAVPAPPFDGVAVPGIRVVVTDPAQFRPFAVGVQMLAVVRGHGLEQGVGDIIDRPEMLDLLAGTDRLRLDLVAGVSPAGIIAGWQADLDGFGVLRGPYLLYG